MQLRLAIVMATGVRGHRRHRCLISLLSHPLIFYYSIVAHNFGYLQKRFSFGSLSLFA